MRPILSKRRGISELLSYVLLAGLAISLSILVYNWLRFYVIPSTPQECPDGVSLILQEYTCINNRINITVKNKGLFRVDGYIIRVNNETDIMGNPQGLPTYQLKPLFEQVINPGEEGSSGWDYTDYRRIVEVEIEPFRWQENKKVYCDKAIVKQVIKSLDCL